MRSLRTSVEMVEGVASVRVSPSDSVVQVEFDPRAVGVRHILKNIEVYIQYINFNSVHENGDAEPLMALCSSIVTTGNQYIHVH